MEFNIITLEKKWIIGKSVEMSLVANQTPDLWKSFLPNIEVIQNRTSQEYISASVYPLDYFQQFDPKRIFQKWAGVEVSAVTNVDGFNQLEIPSGLYSVFLYKGLPSEAGAFYQNLFMNWLPNSGYQLDNRPHFEVMGERYRNDDPSSEELVYIPIKPR